MKELELKLSARDKELEEYKAVAKYNDRHIKDYQNNSFGKCLFSGKIKELEVALRKKDQEFIEYQKPLKKNEEIAQKNQVRLKASENKWANQAVQIKILQSKVMVMEEELDLYDWWINWNDLVGNNGDIESTSFHTDPDLYGLSLSMNYNIIEESCISIYITTEMNMKSMRDEFRPFMGLIMTYILYLTTK